MSAVRDPVFGTLVLGLAETITMPWKLGAGVIIPAGRYVRVIRSAGTAVCAITAATKQVL